MPRSTRSCGALEADRRRFAEGPIKRTRVAFRGAERVFTKMPRSVKEKVSAVSLPSFLAAEKSMEDKEGQTTPRVFLSKRIRRPLWSNVYFLESFYTSIVIQMFPTSCPYFRRKIVYRTVCRFCRRYLSNPTCHLHSADVDKLE